MTTSTPMGCTEAVAHLWELLDGDLHGPPRAALDEHLRWCLRCCGELAFARELREMLQERTSPAVPADVRSRLEGFIDLLDEPPGGPGGEAVPG